MIWCFNEKICVMGTKSALEYIYYTLVDDFGLVLLIIGFITMVGFGIYFDKGKNQ